MRFEHGPRFAADVLDARPAGAEWAILGRDGRLGETRLDLQGLEGKMELHVSRDGHFGAVVERFGFCGRVFDLRDGRVSMRLQRGDYDPTRYSVFSVAFVERKGRTLLVHATDWNRLDVSDPEAGMCLTARGPTVATDPEARPPHYLDYFHAGLHPSPGGRWIAEDGWYWHPLGRLRLWSLADWLEHNVWESEDGPSIRGLTNREYFWDTPIAWIDANRLAFWGEGDDAESMRAVVRIYDTRRGEEVARIEGPEIEPALAWPPGSARTGWLTYDGLLFAVSPTQGTGAWTLGGERLHFEASFAPRRFHPVRKEFLSWDDDKAFVSRLVP